MEKLKDLDLKWAEGIAELKAIEGIPLKWAALYFFFTLNK